MKKLLLVGMLLFGVLVQVAGGGIALPTSTAGSPGPAEVVAAYYDWYLGYVAGEGSGAQGGQLRNPLVDGAYRRSPHLAPELVAKVDELVANFEGGGFDPFLMAQDVPTAVEVGEAQVAGKLASVPVTSSFAGHAFIVSLEQAEGGQWLITGVNPA